MSITHPRLYNKVAIVTGASSGLGRAISIGYAREGAKLICADLQPSARAQVPTETEIDTHELIQREGGKAIFVHTDVGEAKQMEALVKRAVEEYGRVDMSVLTASTLCIPHLSFADSDLKHGQQRRCELRSAQPRRAAPDLRTRLGRHDADQRQIGLSGL